MADYVVGSVTVAADGTATGTGLAYAIHTQWMSEVPAGYRRAMAPTTAVHATQLATALLGYIGTNEFLKLNASNDPMQGNLDMGGYDLTHFFSEAPALDGSEDAEIYNDSNPDLIGSHDFDGDEGDVIAIGVRIWCVSTSASTGKHLYETVAYIQIGSSSSAFLKDPALLQVEVNPLTGLTLSYDFDGTNTLEVYGTSDTTIANAAVEFWNQPARTLTVPT